MSRCFRPWLKMTSRNLSVIWLICWLMIFILKKSPDFYYLWMKLASINEYKSITSSCAVFWAWNFQVPDNPPGVQNLSIKCNDIPKCIFCRWDGIHSTSCYTCSSGICILSLLRKILLKIIFIYSHNQCRHSQCRRWSLA